MEARRKQGSGEERERTAKLPECCGLYEGEKKQEMEAKGDVSGQTFQDQVLSKKVYLP